MGKSIGMTHERTWTGNQKGRNDNVNNRHEQMGARINTNNHLEYYRPSNTSGPGAVINSINTETLGATLTLLVADAEYQFLDPGGASRDVVLPAEADSTGYRYYIFNTADAAENLVVKDDGGNTILTIAQNESGIVVCNGTVWKGLVGANT
ncbi:MAG: hypothetical protein H8D67_22915 [Deltaproteobacteria bacterium]|nr:hypothetical protein [Deltaproteobacteria bacterium]